MPRRLAAQRALADAPWPEGNPVRVRMGLHTGVAEVAGADYAGLEVHRAARIADAAHGGQLIISETTRALIASALPPGVSVRDLGAHRLKDLTQPERLFQVSIDGLPAEFPPLRTRGRRLIVLPTRTTSFIGRVADIERISALLERAPLVTLTGPGGTGKTSIAVEVAARTGTAYADGAVFVGLAALRDPALVAPAIARALELSEEPGRSPEDVVLARLAAAQLLLVLDNLEQLPDAGPLIAKLAAAGPEVRVLATSRAPLRVGGEAEYRLGPLALPDAALGADPATRGAGDAIQLFVERAQRVDPAFTLTAENVDAVAEICATLDGLPLAIELAAARLRVLTPEAIRLRLDQRLRLLTGGARDAPERQQTLRATIDWSHELLDAPTATLFRRQAVFQGGWTLAAAEAVTDTPDALDGLEALVNQSLVVRDDADGAEPRFRMLETIREYALDRLDGVRGADQLCAMPTWPGTASWPSVRARRSSASTTTCARRSGGRSRRTLRAGCASPTDSRASGWRTTTSARGRPGSYGCSGAPGGTPASRARALAELAGLRYWQERYPGGRGRLPGGAGGLPGDRRRGRCRGRALQPRLGGGGQRGLACGTGHLCRGPRRVPRARRPPTDRPGAPGPRDGPARGRRPTRGARHDRGGRHGVARGGGYLRSCQRPL